MCNGAECTLDTPEFCSKCRQFCATQGNFRNKVISPFMYCLSLLHLHHLVLTIQANMMDNGLELMESNGDNVS
jgi:hypothetical protein